MAQSIVSSAANRLGDLLIQHATFLYGVTDQVESLQTELRRMKFFLKDADARQQGDERVKNWVAEIRSLAYDAEDVIDTFILKSAAREGIDLQCDLQQILRRYASLFCKWIEFCKVGKEIGTIQNKIRSISSSLQAYGIRNIGEGEGTSSGNERQRRLRMSYPHVKEAEIVGFKKDIEVLVAELLKEEEQVRVVSIAGMGGLGKTTLAKKVHNHGVVKKHFDCTAWVTLSQQFQVRDILLGILVKISSDENREKNEKLIEEELFEKLYKILEQKRYIVVLDDIWTIEAWDSLRSAFPNGRAGSKVLLTTRNKQVAEHADPWGHLHEPRFLNNEESWELFCKKAFPQDPIEGWCCTPDLEKMGKEMLVKCGGLPLAVIVLGGLLATKRSRHKWEMVSNDIFYHINKDTGVSEILDLSFQDLPYYLKPCFLYLGLFPEDYEIKCKRLIRLWIAEGFLDPVRTRREESIMEDIAEEWLAELIQRCVVHAGARGSRGNVKTCRIHDVIRDRCLSKARDEDFLKVFHPGNVVTTKPRRLAVYSKSSCDLPSGNGNRHVRSLLCFFGPGERCLVNSTLEDLKLLRVLDLGTFPIDADKLKPLGSLIHLRYLSLQFFGSLEGTKVIENLPGLQSIRLQSESMKDYHKIMPNVMSNMRQLRHLYLEDWIEVRQFRMDMLNNLQTLWHINGGSWIEEGDLSKLKNLRKLGVRDIERPEQVETILESSPIKLDHLRTLSLEIYYGTSFPSLEPLSSCRQLSKLYLDGKIREDLHPHHPHGFIPPNITKLTLENSDLEIDPMGTLEKLPNLSYLRLGNCSYMGRKIVCSTKGFPQLEYLELYYLRRLEEWRVEKGAMPCLGRLFIQGCEELRTLPEGLMFIASLQKLGIRGMPIKFVKRIQQNEGIEGEDYYKVQHISSVDTVQNIH